MGRFSVPIFAGYRTMVAFYDGNWRNDGTQRVRDRREWHLPARNGAGGRAGRSFLSRVSGHLLYVATTDDSRRVSRLSSDCSRYARIRTQFSPIRVELYTPLQTAADLVGLL